MHQVFALAAGCDWVSILRKKVVFSSMPSLLMALTSSSASASFCVGTAEVARDQISQVAFDRMYDRRLRPLNAEGLGLDLPVLSSGFFVFFGSGQKRKSCRTRMAECKLVRCSSATCLSLGFVLDAIFRDRWKTWRSCSHECTVKQLQPRKIQRQHPFKGTAVCFSSSQAERRFRSTKSEGVFITRNPWSTKRWVQTPEPGIALEE